ncbi:protein-L-isoaspartate(D-aspartate) O-methyltransferase [Methylovirgula ligni]|nr:protein-L-isoaspartate(D-aspartate) O-methyltransferase [Methylovirgula ligni]
MAVAEEDAATARGEEKAAFLLRLRSSGIRDLDLLRALEKVPREMFVPHRFVDLARRDLALPIGCGQTLSEPSLVARMIAALGVTREQRVLEIGTGSGYATAILAEIGAQVVSIERFQTLAIAARLRLERLGRQNVEVIFADGLGVPAAAGPFDRILIHARLDELPPDLVALLVSDGRIVVARPDREVAWRQVLVELRRDAAGALVETQIGPCRLQALLPGIAQVL